MKRLATVLFSFSVVISSQARSEGIDVESPEAIAKAARAIDDLHFVGEDEIQNEHGFHQSLTLASYAHLDPKHWVPTDLLEKAVLYFDKNKTRFPNQKFISVVDFSRRSDAYRFFLVNMKTGAVERYHTTHGYYSDENLDGWADVFGNVPGSGKSSLGPVRTAEVYSGTYKRAIRLDGLASTNSKVRERAIVFHGWDKTREANVIQAYSMGCITMDYSVKDAVLDRIKEGSLIYVGLSRD